MPTAMSNTTIAVTMHTKYRRLRCFVNRGAYLFVLMQLCYAVAFAFAFLAADGGRDGGGELFLGLFVLF